jgi:hypothetical protein
MKYGLSLFDAESHSSEKRARKYPDSDVRVLNSVLNICPPTSKVTLLGVSASCVALVADLTSVKVVILVVLIVDSSGCRPPGSPRRGVESFSPTAAELRSPPTRLESVCVPDIVGDPQEMCGGLCCLLH